MNNVKPQYIMIMNFNALYNTLQKGEYRLCARKITIIVLVQIGIFNRLYIH